VVSATETTAGYPALVLVVDDNLALRTILSAILTQEGYRVQTAAHGGHALDFMRASPEPVVVTLDLNMPDVNGIAVLEAVAADPVWLQRHALILLTDNVALAASRHVTALRDQLHVPLVAKPFTVEQLLDAVAEAEQRLTGGGS
jgi:CheY-like chemotaxis protein